jgi:hypothetical protein
MDKQKKEEILALANVLDISGPELAALVRIYAARLEKSIAEFMALADSSRAAYYKWASGHKPTLESMTKVYAAYKKASTEKV